MEVNADEYRLEELGIEKRGSFNAGGGIDDWEIDYEYIADGLPRWLLKEPVLTLMDNGDVYVRGMYSATLSRERRLM